MTPPDWKNCTENELWRYVAWHLEGAGIGTVLVGGAVVSIYTGGLYRSGDLDLIPEDFARSRIPQVLEALGFISAKSRHYKHPDCNHLVVEFPLGPVSLGDEYPVTPDEMVVEGRTIRILSPTDCVKDRLAAFIHWGSRDCFDQAILVCQTQKEQVNLQTVAAWCQREGGAVAFEKLLARLSDFPTPP
jgi:hypothetical protein